MHLLQYQYFPLRLPVIKNLYSIFEKLIGNEF